MHLESYRIMFIVIGLVGILLFSLPAMNLIVKSPTGETFSELYVLGPNHTFDDIPFNVKAGQTYTLYVGVGNHIGSVGYYTLYVKMSGPNDQLPNSTLSTPSLSYPLYGYNCIIDDGQTWEAPLTFKIESLTFRNGICYMPKITINGIDYQVNEQSAWNANKTGYYYTLITELWGFDTTSSTDNYQNLSNRLTLKMTA
jgi:hypothetical protein